MDTVLSGIRSTGNLHLGNYFGALRNFIRMQDENKCYFLLPTYIHSPLIPTQKNSRNVKTCWWIVWLQV